MHIYMDDEEFLYYENYGRYKINDLSPKQGMIMGLALRHTLLSCLPSLAFTAIRSPSILNEFSIVSGVREDVLEIILNLKQIILKNNNKDSNFNSEVARIKIQGPGIITGEDIELPSSNLEIVNPWQYIMSLSSNEIFEMEILIEEGNNYKLKEFQGNIEETGFLYIDSIFMPVKKATFKVDEVITENQSLKETLTFDILTDGSLSAEAALLEASKILVEFFKPLSECSTPIKKQKVEINSYNKRLKKLLDYQINSGLKKANLLHSNSFLLDKNSIETLGLSNRALNSLKKEGVFTTYDLVKKSKENLMSVKNFGKKCLKEVEEVLINYFKILLN